MDEKDLLLKSVMKFSKEITSVAKIAKDAGINPNRARFIMEELIQDGKVVKVLAKKYNERFLRYRYEVTK